MRDGNLMTSELSLRNLDLVSLSLCLPPFVLCCFHCVVSSCLLIGLFTALSCCPLCVDPSCLFFVVLFCSSSCPTLYSCFCYRETLEVLCPASPAAGMSWQVWWAGESVVDEPEDQESTPKSSNTLNGSLTSWVCFTECLPVTDVF